MKKGLIFATTLAMALGVGVAVGAHQRKVAEVKAESTSGSLVVKFQENHNWFEAGAKICAYMTDDTNDYWTSLQTTTSTTLLYKFDYNVSFTPTKLIWVRMNPSETQGSWDDGKKWNQTGDLEFKEATYIENGWDYPGTSQWTVSAEVRSNQVPPFEKKATLSNIGLNVAGNPEVSGSVTLVKDEEFKILAGDGVWSGFYGRPEALAGAIDGGSMEEVSPENPNIKCLIAGTYDFYFDTETKKLWITRQDIVDADGWASYFLNNVGCDATGVNEPTGWASCASEYAKLSNDAKDYVYGGKADKEGDNLGRALARYDQALLSHPGLTHFIVNSSDTPRASIYINHSIGEIGNSSILIVVISVSAVSALAFTLLLVFKKKRHN